MIKAELKDSRLKGICGHRLVWQENNYEDYSRVISNCCGSLYKERLIVVDGMVRIELTIFEGEGVEK